MAASVLFATGVGVLVGCLWSGIAGAAAWFATFGLLVYIDTLTGRK
ncbi:MAG: hypothetical protein ABIH03_07535 [Pseudomonadota bacterium]